MCNPPTTVPREVESAQTETLQKDLLIYSKYCRFVRLSVPLSEERDDLTPLRAHTRGGWGGFRSPRRVQGGPRHGFLKCDVCTCLRRNRSPNLQLIVCVALSAAVILDFGTIGTGPNGRLRLPLWSLVTVVLPLGRDCVEVAEGGVGRGRRRLESDVCPEL